MRLLLILLLAPAVAIAELQYITIPGEGWHLTIDAPPLTKTGAKSREGSETVLKTDSAPFSTYQSEGVYKGEPFKTANAHAYIAKDGICADVHVSHWPYTEDSDALVAAIITSVTILD